MSPTLSQVFIAGLLLSVFTATQASQCVQLLSAGQRNVECNDQGCLHVTWPIGSLNLKDCAYSGTMMKCIRDKATSQGMEHQGSCIAGDFDAFVNALESCGADQVYSQVNNASKAGPLDLQACYCAGDLCNAGNACSCNSGDGWGASSSGKASSAIFAATIGTLLTLLTWQQRS